MELANVAIDIFSIVLCVALGAYVLASDGVRDRISQCFAGICFSNALMAAGDITSWLFTPPLGSFEYGVVLVGAFFFYAATAPIFLFFSEYIVTYLKGKGARPRGYLKIFLTLFGLYLAGCVLSLFGDGFFFVVTPESGYTRGPYFMLAQIVPIVLHMRNAALVVKHRALLSTREKLGFASYIVLPMLAEAIQVCFFGVALMNAFIACAVLFVFLNIQAEQKVLLARREQELTEAHADIMLSQIQPHFLYNTLTAIRELCLTDPPSAVDAITDFSLFLRANIASLSNREPIPFEQELDHVRTYLALEQRRFGDRLHITYDVQTADFTLPALSLQVLVENAVRHGVTQRREGGTVCIAVREDEGAVVATVADDGVGFDTRMLSVERRNGGIGLTNVRARVEALCNGSLEVHSTPGAGTTVAIRLPRTPEQ